MRCDVEFGTRLGAKRHRYFLEEQDTGLDRKRWAQKFRGYISYYELTKKPFRVLVRVRTEREWTKAIEVCFEEMGGHEQLNLFVFSMDGVRWFSRWGSEARVE